MRAAGAGRLKERDGVFLALPVMRATEMNGKVGRLRGEGGRGEGEALYGPDISTPIR